MKNCAAAFLTLLLVSAGPASAQFTGSFELIDNPADGTKKKLKDNFGYVDPDGVGWEAKAGLVTDGASIPGWAKPFVGGSFDKDFVKAAVLHDHYCDRHVRGWRLTHRLFYNVLLESGVTKAKAKIMYYAVMVGGPKWTKLMLGEKCKVTKACIKSVVIESDLVTDVTEETFDAIPNFESQLKAVEGAVSGQGEDISLETLEALALTLNPQNRFLGKPDTIELELTYPEK